MFARVIAQTVLPPISIKAETLFQIPLPWGGSFGFTNSMLQTLLVIFGITLFFFLATRKMRLVPSGAQNAAESIVELLLGIVEGTAGKRVGRRIFPLIATLFIFILIANYSGLLPGVGTIGHCVVPATAEAPAGGGLATPESAHICTAPATEFVPYLRAPNADLNMTLAMALLAVVIVQVAGIASHGLGGYLKELATPWYLTPIHIVGEISRVISLSFRLFGNIFGGEVLVTVMYVLLGSLFLGFATFIFLGIELLFGLIQALIFSILTLVFIATAVGGHGSHEGSHEAPPGSVEEKGQEIAYALTGQGGKPRSGPKVPGTDTHGGTEQHVGG
jgi:F-type H+-transporting ATPase subunit a